MFKSLFKKKSSEQSKPPELTVTIGQSVRVHKSLVQFYSEEGDRYVIPEYWKGSVVCVSTDSDGTFVKVRISDSTKDGSLFVDQTVSVPVSEFGETIKFV